MCTCAFPLEGNGNSKVSLSSNRRRKLSRAHVLSRLKGMETYSGDFHFFPPWKGAHVLSRLKGMETLYLPETD